jgi:hypothetical protein
MQLPCIVLSQPAPFVPPMQTGLVDVFRTATPSTWTPTLSPTTSRPTATPTLSPTTSRPTATRTLSPTTSRPTATPTLSPTTSRPTATRTLSPTLSPTRVLPPTAACTWGRPQPTVGFPFQLGVGFAILIRRSEAGVFEVTIDGVRSPQFDFAQRIAGDVAAIELQGPMNDLIDFDVYAAAPLTPTPVNPMVVQRRRQEPALNVWRKNALAWEDSLPLRDSDRAKAEKYVTEAKAENVTEGAS